MRKFLLMLLGAVVAATAHAQVFTVEDGGITYTYQILSSDDLQCEVYKVKDVPEDAVLTVPFSVVYNNKTYQVVELANNCYSGQPLKSITIHNGIRALGMSTFYGCTHLESISLPEGIVGTYDTFNGCTSLETVTLPSSLRNLGQSTFKGCTSLTSVVLPASVTTIGYQAFMDCTGLQTIDLPASLTTIDRDAFEGCSSLSAVRLHDLAAWCNITYVSGGTSSSSSSPTFQNPEGCHLYLNDEEILDLVIPDGVTSLPIYAFARTPLRSAVLPESVTSIGLSAFAYCSALTSVSLPATLETLATGVFYGCSSLPSLSLPASLTSIGQSCFSGCSSLQALEIPEGITSLSYGSFAGCSSLRSLVLPHSLTSSSVDLSGCSDLTLTLKTTNVTTDLSVRQAISKLILTEQVESIAKSAFRGCTYLNEVVFSEGLTAIAGDGFAECTALTSVQLPESLESLGQGAFRGCTSLQTVDFPESLTSLGTSAFEGCTSLASLTLPAVATIGSSAFKGCTSLATLVVPVGVESVGSEAFRNCTSLTSLILSEGCTQVDTYAFAGCELLASVTVPSTMQSIGRWAFDGCTSLAHVTLNSVEAGSWFAGCPITTATLGSTVRSLIGTFADCTQLETIQLPFGLTTISGTFSGCTALQGITIPSSVTTIGDATFSGCTSLAELQMQGSSVTLGKNVFENCSSLVAVALPSSVTTLPERLFAGCSSLREVTFPYALQTIGQQAFEGCTSLPSFECPSSLTTIQQQAFMGCTKLQILTFSSYSGITLQAEAFKGCTGLQTITFPEYYPGRVTISGDGVFAGCSGLTSLTLNDVITLLDDWTYSSRYLFKDCTGLKRLVISSESVAASTTLTEGCTQLEEVEFNCGTVGPCVAGRTSLQRATVNGQVIGMGAFAGCTSLEDVELSDGTNEVQSGAFQNCTALKSFTATSGMNVLAADAFSGCTNLRYLDLRPSYSLLSDYFEMPSFEDQNTLIYLPEYFEAIEHQWMEEYDEFGNPVGGHEEEMPVMRYSRDYYGYNRNVVCPGDWGDLQCNNLSIIDGRPVGVPEEFRTYNVENTRTIMADTDAYTLCLPYPLALPEGLKAYTLGSFTAEGALVFTEMDGNVLEANQPYLVVASQDVSLNTYDETIVPATPDGDVFVERGAIRFCGTVAGMTHAQAATAGAYILQAGNEWHPVREENANATIPAGRSYLLTDQAAGVKAFTSMLADTPTAVTRLQLTDRDGASAIYDLSGRRLSSPRKGINVVRRAGRRSEKIYVEQ